MRSETLNCYKNNAGKSCKVRQQEELRRAGLIKRAIQVEGHNSSSFAGKNQPPPGEQKYCKSLMKERQNLKDESLPQLSFAGSHSLPFVFL